MANWNNPTLTSTYTDVLTELKDRDVDATIMYEGASPTNTPTNAKRYNNSLDRFEYWDGAAWAALPLAVTEFTGTFTVPNGGTGLTTIPTGRLLYGNGTSAISTSSNLTYDGTTFTILGTPSGNIFKVGATSGGDAFLASGYAAGAGALLGALNGALSDWEPLTLAGEGVFVDLRTGAGTKANFAKFSNDISTFTSGAAGLELYGPTNYAALRLAGPSASDLFLTSGSSAAYLLATTAVPIIIGLNNAEIGRFSGSSFHMGDTATIYGRIQSTVGAGSSVPTLGNGSGHLTLSNRTYGLAAGVNTSGNSWLQSHRFDGTATAYDLLLQPVGGGVAVGASANVPGATGYTHLRLGAGQVMIAHRSNPVDAAYYQNSYYDGVARYIGSGYAASGYYQGNGSHQWLYAASGTSGEKITWQVPMYLATSGSLGLGTTSPDSFMAGTSGICIKKSAPGLTLSSATRDFVAYINGDTFCIYDRQIPADVFRIIAGGNVAIGSHAPLGKFDVRSTSGAQITASYDASNRLDIAASSTGGTSFTHIGSNPYFLFYGDNASTPTRIQINNANANAYGAYTNYQTQSVVRGYIGALKHGSAGDVLFTGETADGFGVRAETALEMGISSTGLMRLTSGGLAIGSLFNPSHLLHVSKDQNAATRVQLDNANAGGSAYAEYVVTSNTVVNKLTAAGYAGYGFMGTTSAHNLAITAGASTGIVVQHTDQFVGIGTSAPAARLHVVRTGEQLRLGYDASNYLSFAISSAGVATLTPTGGLLTVSSNSRNIQIHSPTAHSLYVGSLPPSITGQYNTSFGLSSLVSNTTGVYNTAIGNSSLSSNTTGYYNIAMGFGAANFNEGGNSNVALGSFALFENTSGSNNVAIGYQALDDNTVSTNTALGAQALRFLVSYTNCTGLGFESAVTASNQVQLGNSSTTTYAYGAVQDRSDIRDKADVRDTVLGLDFISRLRVVDFRRDYREDYPKGIRDGSKKRSRFHHGLIAQEVKQVIEDTGIDFGGFQHHSIAGGQDVMSIGYSELIGPMIKAIQELEAEIEQLKQSK